MQIFIENQFTYALFSCLLGIVMGLIYDIFSLIPIMFNRTKGFMLLDFIFMTLWGLTIIVVTYDKNFGSYRWYSFFFSGCTFYLYRATVGKLILKINKTIITFIYKIIFYLLKKANNLLDFFVKFVKIFIVKIQTDSYVNKIFKEAEIPYKRKEQYEKRRCKNKKAEA